MSITRRRWAAATIATAFVMAGCSGNNGAEDSQASGGSGDFPTQPINLIVPYAAGGSADSTARQLAAVAQDTCGVPIIIRNATGGSGLVGFETTLASPADGYTVGTASIELSMLGHMGIGDIQPDDYQGILQYSEQPVVFGVPADSPYQSLQDVIDSEDRITVATSGTGGIYHLGFESMSLAAGIQDRTVNVPFDGAASALQAALGDQTDMVSVGAAEMRPHIESGALRPLAIAGAPVDYLPEDVPTLQELGLDSETTAILGLYTPAGVPQDRVEILNECFNQARESEQFSNYMETTGLNQRYRDADEFDQFMGEEYDRYGELINEIGMGGQQS
ncbi:Bug family tripartite tricarboxylate transporter substrate binding protein [Kocuria sp.]|uniref:Bug family tripartite tricarboxylate transporter substrate binding protein n=1 Tax=Kocuria sp. TaxID=1871328 RepID=UPI0026DF8E8C|nr:tripartite tricarboxylate transporter substrate binding protein [Kocuria sp.]MDO5618676.1 tripartite tricarboxylate transporter substrate binding protein [Kocuria sp.]